MIVMSFLGTIHSGKLLQNKVSSSGSLPGHMTSWMSLMFCIRSPTLSSHVLETVSRAVSCVAITSELKYSFFGEDGSIQEVNGTDKVLKF